MDAAKKSSLMDDVSHPPAGLAGGIGGAGGAHDSGNGTNVSMERLTDDFSPTTSPTLPFSGTPSSLALPSQSPGMARRLKRSRQSLKRAMTRLHRTLINLDSFRALTYTACVKILKKRDKLALR